METDFQKALKETGFGKDILYPKEEKEKKEKFENSNAPLWLTSLLLLTFGTGGFGGSNEMLNKEVSYLQGKVDTLEKSFNNHLLSSSI